MEPFTVVIPIKGTKEEAQFFRKSIISTFKLQPNEIIIGVDFPFNTDWKQKIVKIFNEFNFTNFRIIEVKKSQDWKFQLAKVVWECYKASQNDCIFSYDIDSLVRPIIRIGLKQIGNDNIAVISFTKKLLITSISDRIRYIFYRIRVRQSEYVFSGNYWVFRPYYFDLLSEQEMKQIYNGVDNILTQKILKDSKYKIITRKEIGVSCLTIQNEDMDWRQFQDGIWFYANMDKFKKIRKIKNEQRKRHLLENDKFLPVQRLNFRFRSSIGSILDKHPKLFVLIKTLLYQYWHLLEGYSWSKKNPNSEAVKLARTMSFSEWGYKGSKFLPKKKWKHRGTGYVEE